MVSDTTQQFLYRAVIGTVCGITGAIFIFLFIAALTLGDGEAVRIIDAMTPLAVTSLGAMVTTALGSHAAGAYVARQMAQVHIAQIQAPAAVAAAAAPAAAPDTLATVVTAKTS